MRLGINQTSPEVIVDCALRVEQHGNFVNI